MCGCNDTAGFQQYLSKAQQAEKITKTKQIVYIRKLDGQERFYIRPLADAGTDIMQGVNVYFTTDGMEHKNVSKIVETPEKPTEEVPKKKRSKK